MINEVKHRRERAAYHFEIQASRLQFKIVERLRNYRYRLYDERKAKELTAIVLPESFDFYDLRLNRGKHRVDMVICDKHNAVLPVRCVSIAESYEYAPHASPMTLRELEKVKRRSTDEVNVFVSKLLLGHQTAITELNGMPARTKQRMLAKRDSYLTPKVGRPWTS